MIKLLKEEKTPLIIIFSIFVLCLIFGWGHFGDILIDCGREAYIPLSITKGSVLYKDIFCIYGPFAYLFNAFFIKIFGAKLSVYYVIGAVLSAFFTLAIYFISREFLSKLLSTLFTTLILFSVVFSTSIFNFIFPYSYSMLFAVVFSIWILYFLIRFIHTKEISWILYSMLLWGAICVSKVELTACIVPILTLFFIYSKNKISTLPKLLGCALFVPFLVYLVLFTQGVNFSDFAKNSYFLSKMLSGDSLRIFYSNYGILFFNTSIFKYYFLNTFFFVFVSAIYFSVSFFAIKIKEKIKRNSTLTFAFLFYFLILLFGDIPLQGIFALLPYFISIVFIIYCYKFLKSGEYNNPNFVSLLTLLLFSIFCALKNYHILLLAFYGSFSAPLLILSLVICLKNYFETNLLFHSRAQYELILSLFLLALILLYANSFVFGVIAESYHVKTKFGVQKVVKNIGQPFDDTINFLQNEMQQGDTLFVMPEGIMLNFLLGKKWDFYQTSFIPLDFDTFSEDNIINEVKINEPDYLVINTRNTKEYGYGVICNNYGQKTCQSILKNYNLEAAFGEKFRMYVFKLKSKKSYEK